MWLLHTYFWYLHSDWELIHLDRVKRIWYLSPMRAAKVQASLRIRAVSPEPSLLAHTSSESRGIFRQKARSLAPLNGWACAVKLCRDGMLEDTNSLDGAHLEVSIPLLIWCCQLVTLSMLVYIAILSISSLLIFDNFFIRVRFADMLFAFLERQFTKYCENATDEGLDGGVWNSLISKHLAHYSLSLKFLLIL